MRKMDKKTSFETSIEKLEKIVHELTSEDLTLEASIKTYKEGMALVKHCNDSIEKIEKELEILTNRKA
ncbi:MAG: exodeoxyribonuclease VII small subunit [Vallitaleaceae bacterium]|nr:exodeoxyribonuclease VII small subunit [Vallitaleaceae bacterium]